MDLNKLKAAVEGWLRADWAFRVGPERHAYATQVKLAAAEDRLRFYMTGCTDLEQAGNTFGWIAPPPPKAVVRKAAAEKIAPVKRVLPVVKPAAKRREGFFT